LIENLTHLELVRSHKFDQKQFFGLKARKIVFDQICVSAQREHGVKIRVRLRRKL